jgi:hypothetical protein
MPLFVSRFGGYERYEGGVLDDLVLAGRRVRGGRLPT